MGGDLDSRFELRGRSLRTHTARGGVVNALYAIALNSLGLVKGFVVAVFLTASEYGIWGILFISYITLAWLKQVGVDDKFVQQDEPDQKVSFQRAFRARSTARAARRGRWRWWPRSRWWRSCAPCCRCCSRAGSTVSP